MKLVVKLFINTVAVLVAAYLIPGVEVENVVTALVVSVVLGVLNTFIKPVLVLLTLPINIVTLGLFTFVINAFLVVITSQLIPGFIVGSLIDAIWFSIIVSLVSFFLGTIAL